MKTPTFCWKSKKNIWKYAKRLEHKYSSCLSLKKKKKKSPDFGSSFLLAHLHNDAPVRSRGHSLNFLDVNEQPKENVNLCKQ